MSFYSPNTYWIITPFVIWKYNYKRSPTLNFHLLVNFVTFFIAKIEVFYNSLESWSWMVYVTVDGITVFGQMCFWVICFDWGACTAEHEEFVLATQEGVIWNVSWAETWFIRMNWSQCWVTLSALCPDRPDRARLLDHINLQRNVSCQYLYFEEIQSKHKKECNLFYVWKFLTNCYLIWSWEF